MTFECVENFFHTHKMNPYNCQKKDKKKDKKKTKREEDKKRQHDKKTK